MNTTDMGISGIRSKIMIVDDNVANLTMARNLLKSFYDVYLSTSANQMFEMLGKIRPDLILLDIEMPGMDGYEAMAKLKESAPFADVPVIFLTGRNNVLSELKGFDLGAADYIYKPFSPPILLKRVEHQLLLVRQQEMIRFQANNLSVLVDEKIQEVVNLQNTILGTVADLVEFRDQFTGEHVARSQSYMKILIDGLRADKLYGDEISGWNVEYVLQSAQLHDVGKIAISDVILNKPGRLTSEDMETMKTHVTVGVDAISRIIGKTKEQAFLRYAINIVGTHHEKWDGTGYPYGLKGGDIPLEGRLMAVADVYDALVSWRPYKEKMSHEQAIRIIREGGGTHFDPVLVDVFLARESMFEHISSQNAPDGGGELGVVAFTADMEIGCPEIDAQHKEFIARLNTIISMKAASASMKKTRETLEYLGDYVIRHFTDEETLQKHSGYPNYELHKRLHQFFIYEYRQLREEFDKAGFSAGFSQKLGNSLTGWLLRHIKLADMEFGKYYQACSPLTRRASRRCLLGSARIAR